ncbi:MAG: curli assembly protein CsgF [Polaromonas sp.]|nr:curli assembly protein CsgF [Polaromonas sp.]
MNFSNKQVLPAPVRHWALAAMLAACGAPSGASELVYAPVNPSFGGSPLNGPVLLNAAQAQSRYQEPESALLQKTGLQDFNDLLERSILSQLASAATASVLGSNGRLTPGTVDTGNFRINILDLGAGALRITTTDTLTGQTTSFQVAQ